jgi:hypothetical protein
MQHPFVVVSAARRVSIVFAGVLLSTLALAAAIAVPRATASTSFTVTFHYNGTMGADGTPQHWTVPSNVRSITVDVYGAEGGKLVPSPREPLPVGGKGGYVHAALVVSPGEVLTIYVGGHGGDVGVPIPNGIVYCREPGLFGGYNGGGRGGGGNCPGAGGGGASDIRSGTDSLLDRLIVAGGGGGAANSCADLGGGCADGGNGGGTIGESGFKTELGVAPPGGGGTQSAGGSAGVPGSVGTFGIGGPGEDGVPNVGGGGGGGGWYGGGGGGTAVDDHAAGGGGGSGHVVASATEVTMTSGARSGNGLVSITYVPLPVPTTINQCFHGGWRNVVDTQGRPFNNQGLCVAFVVHQQRGT